jgi:hypothetical protein
MDVRYAQVPVDGIRGKLIRNPGYGGSTVSLNGWCWRPIVSVLDKPLFQEALRESIREAGVRNPVIVYALAEGDFLSFGGSRLRAVRDLGLERLPALVNDYVGRYSECPAVTEENWQEFFTDVPEYLEFTPDGVDTHYSIERNRRDHHDPAGLEWAGDAEFIAKEFPWVAKQ